MTAFTVPLANCADKVANRFPDLVSHPAAVGYTLPNVVLERNNVRVFGHGKQVLLLCNGFGCSQHIWHRLTAALSTRYRLVLFDYVGSGGSDFSAYTPERYSSLAGYVQDVLEICQALDLREVTLVGHSIGASIAMLATIAAPQYFSHLVALAASPHFLIEDDYYGGFSREDVEQLLGLMQVNHDSWANLFAGMLLGTENHDLLSKELAQHFCNADSHIAQHFARVSFFSDCRADLAYVPVPTLLVQCSQDMAAPSEVGDYLLAHLPEATLVQLSTTGHCPHLSAPLETLAAMDAFLAV
ncbi:alpha/beta hydrolase (plasmid) [Hymenobacter tibetensis]|uniref:Alpha/beta hydrolase n=1 Tax=Hymenobacter tibetensis TaxID=497967 RepID=A0ABY4D5I2_9BACT|nr:alpha/beta hydrolase [Hymenobacter tibetensis]UOG77307.1 alpha/beta hydrolase [Hymenobacter tibetensis]